MSSRVAPAATSATSAPTLRLAAVGDLLLTVRPGSAAPGRGLEALTPEVHDLLASCDVVVANLESTLPGPNRVPTEPRVVTTEGQVRSLRRAGVTVVSLANNHAFDFYDEGFHRLRDLLDDLALPHFGAGDDLAEASRPAILEVKGQRLAFLGAVDASTGPNRFAGEGSSGVPRLDLERLCRAVAALRSEVDHVVVCPHWGEERFRFPSPRQVEQARALIDAGASLVLGHHPHVLQGLELHNGAPIAYSLGNFLSSDVYWESGDALTWSRFERVGCLLVAELDETGVRGVRQVPTYDDGTTVRLETSGWGGCCLARANSYLARGVTEACYRREALRVRRLLPLLAQLHWSKLRKVRPGHFVKAAKLLLGLNPKTS